MRYSCKLTNENEKTHKKRTRMIRRKKSVTASSLADVRVETWTFHHDFPEKTKADNTREGKKRGKYEKVLTEEETERETLILGRKRTNRSRWIRR